MRGRHSGTTAWRIASIVLAAAGSLAAIPDEPSLVTLSIVGTSDLHGAALPRNGLGGLPLLAGYVNNLRAARASDGGAVLLVDAGDTFQGDVDSNLSEGALIVDAYNAMGYTAQAIGNHDFDFGAVDSPLARQTPGDLRGALQARAAQARYPFLAANLIDETTGRLVEWPHVRPSALVEAAGVKVGIIGVMTIDAMRSTLAANVQGLRMAPLAPAIVTEAAKLRSAGADLVVVVSHAGGRCERFDDPADLSSCDNESEIFKAARSLPPGLADVIAAGHTHAGLSHQVNGIGIIQPFSRGQAFGRADVVVDRKARRVVRQRLFAPQALKVAVAAPYEGRPVTPDPAITQAMAPALARVEKLRATPLGLSLDAPIRRVGDVGSPLGNVFATALREAVPGADVAVVSNAVRLWADLPEGPLTFGRVYDVFPFDNRVARVHLTGAELRRWVAGEISGGRGRALGMSGVVVRTACLADGAHVDLIRDAGQPIRDEEKLLAVTTAGPTLSGSLARAVPSDRVESTGRAPVVREVVEDWLRGLGHLAPGRLADVTRRRAEPAGTRVTDCVN